MKCPKCNAEMEGRVKRDERHNGYEYNVAVCPNGDHAVCIDQPHPLEMLVSRARVAALMHSEEPLLHMVQKGIKVRLLRYRVAGIKAAVAFAVSAQRAHRASSPMHRPGTAASTFAAAA